MKIFENKWCTVHSRNGFYILSSKHGKYNDQYYRSMDELRTRGGIDLTLQQKHPLIHNAKAGKTARAKK